jgi:hypothetical protein
LHDSLGGKLNDNSTRLQHPFFAAEFPRQRPAPGGTVEERN